MRTSIILDDELAIQLRAKAKEKGQSLSAFLAEAGRVALSAEIELKENAKPFEVLTCGEGEPLIETNLVKYSELLAKEDEERYGSNK